MKYNPKDGDPVLLPDGWMDATLSAEEKTSQSGNLMMVVTSRVYHNALPVDIYTHFVNGNPSSLNRLKKLCAVLGIDFGAGEVTPDMFSGKGCKVQVKTQKSKDPQYPDDKNVVAYFAAMDAQVADAADIAAWYREHGVDARRGQQSRSGADEPDVILPPAMGLWVECGRRKPGCWVLDKMDQAREASFEGGVAKTNDAVVHARADRGVDVVVVTLEHWGRILERLKQ